jgi:hypothetical protein
LTEQVLDTYLGRERDSFDDCELAEDRLGLFRALPLALAYGILGWALLAAVAYAVYLLVP